MTDQLAEKQTRAKLLVVDDEEVVRIALSDFLISAGYEVDTAVSGEDAMHRLQYGHDRYEIIITDVIMGNMGGLELLEKAIELDADSIVILITGYAMLESAIHAIRKGAYDFLLKPFENSTLLLTIRRGLERRKLIQENRELIQDLTSKNFELNRVIFELRRAQSQLDDCDRRFETPPPRSSVVNDMHASIRQILQSVDDAMNHLVPERGLSAAANALQSIAVQALKIRTLIETLPS